MKTTVCEKHNWDKETGKRERINYMYKTNPIRTCLICGRKEEYNSGPVFFGWYKYEK